MGNGVLVDVAVGSGVGVALLVGEDNRVGLALGVGVSVGVEEATEPALGLALAAGAAARLTDAGWVQLAVPSPLMMTSRQTISHMPERRFR